MNKKIIYLITSTTLLVLPVVSFAIAIPVEPNSTTNQPLSPQEILDKLIGFIWPIVAGIVIILFIVAGFLFMTAQGEPGKLETARKSVIWAVVGIVVMLIGFSILATMKYVLNIY